MSLSVPQNKTALDLNIVEGLLNDNNIVRTEIELILVLFWSIYNLSMDL